jgi:hypothetical protein
MRDTGAMLIQSSPIKILSILSVVVFGGWNILALQITSKVSAVARMVFEQLTIVVVWVAQLAIHWFLKETHLGKAGEEWTKWSWLQLFGFALMVFGACVYQRLVVIPGAEEVECKLGKPSQENRPVPPDADADVSAH